jgi:hypothetical protein
MTVDNRHNQDGPTQGGDDPSSKHQIAIAIDAFKTAYKAAHDDDDKHEEKVFIWTRRAAVGVFIYTVLTFLILVAGIWQIRIAEDTERRSLRAYVFVQKFQIVALNTNGHTSWGLGPIWENAGNSPATDLKASWDCKDGPLGSIDKIDFVSTSKRAEFYPRILGPRQTTLGAACTRTADELGVIQRDKKQISIWGTAEYTDSFGQPHKTRFCTQAQIFGDPNVADSNAQHMFNSCKHGNCADGDCDRQDSETGSTK